MTSNNSVNGDLSPQDTATVLAERLAAADEELAGDGLLKALAELLTRPAQLKTSSRAACGSISPR